MIRDMRGFVLSDKVVHAGKACVVAGEEAAKALMSLPWDIEAVVNAGEWSGHATLTEATSAAYAYKDWKLRVLESRRWRVLRRSPS